jgi:vacuolar protein-sorting-associated protein 4
MSNPLSTRNLQDGDKEHFDFEVTEIVGSISWDDVIGLEKAKASLYEAVVLPIKFPQLFQGNLKPWKGILMFGPPGNGKSYLAKALASLTNSSFFSVSSSDLISKWQGESERLLKGLFESARKKSPSIIFIDEIDSIACSRNDNDNESSRRIKTELLVQIQGVGNDNDGVLLVAATNTPWSLDSALRRRFQKRVYIGLPGKPAIKKILSNSLGMNIPEDVDTSQLVGFSGSDIDIIAIEALMKPLRELQNAKYFKEDGGVYIPCDPSDPCALPGTMYDFPNINTGPVTSEHIQSAIDASRSSIDQKEIEQLEQWNKEFGT